MNKIIKSIELEYIDNDRLKNRLTVKAWTFDGKYYSLKYYRQSGNLIGFYETFNPFKAKTYLISNEVKQEVLRLMLP